MDNISFSPILQNSLILVGSSPLLVEDQSSLLHNPSERCHMYH
jgi:hypothetical protein